MIKFGHFPRTIRAIRGALAPRRPGFARIAARRALGLCVIASCALVFACSTAPPPPKAAPARPAPPPPPAGPTRTDFKEIAKQLIQRCIAGGWINRWRADHENPDVAKPRIFLEPFEDATGQNLDPTYLRSTLEQRMRLSNAFEMAAGPEASDFLGRGKLLRLAERGRGGERFSVYTATLQLVNPSSQQVVYSCEATVRGEM